MATVFTSLVNSTPGIKACRLPSNDCVTTSANKFGENTLCKENRNSNKMTFKRFKLPPIKKQVWRSMISWVTPFLTQLHDFNNITQSKVKNYPGSFHREYIPEKSRIQQFFYTSCLFHFASVKSAITGFLLRTNKVKTVNIEHWKI